MAQTHSYDLATDTGKVRLLLNDVSAPWVFRDDEITAFLSMARGTSVKRAAALAIDANATNEALASKVLKSQDVQTDGAKVADAMRKHAAALRSEADEDDDYEDGGYFQIVDMGDAHCRPERTQWPAL